MLAQRLQWVCISVWLMHSRRAQHNWLSYNTVLKQSLFPSSYSSLMTLKRERWCVCVCACVHARVCVCECVRVVRVCGLTHPLPEMVLGCWTNQGCSLQICNLLLDCTPVKLQRKTKGLNRPRYICMHKDAASDSASTPPLPLIPSSPFFLSNASLFPVIPLVTML